MVKHFKALTCRVDPVDWQYIYDKGCGASFNKALRFFIGMVRDIEAEGLAEVRGYFEPQEWKFMADALKDRVEPLWNKHELSRIVMNIKNMEAASSYYGVKPSKLCDKINELNSIHVLAVTQRIHEFWHRSEFVTMNEWAQY